MVRLREAGILPDGLLEPGPRNAITDVPGVRVGHAELSSSDPAAQTGVTVVLPHGRNLFEERCPAAVWALNGAGECTGSLMINEWGYLDTPILLTGTNSLGRVYDAALDWVFEHNPELAAGRNWTWVIPCVSECDDGWLNDARRHRAGRTELYAALAGAREGPVAEGCVGAGRGMISFGLKGGVGTASRRIPRTPWHVGVLSLCNFGRRPELTLAGVRIGPRLAGVPLPGHHLPPGPIGEGSVIGVIATDAPLDHRELRRLCKRAGLGIGRTGTAARHGSGDLFIAFSVGRGPGGLPDPNEAFHATIEATEESVYNALFAATTTTGREGRTVHALPVDQVISLVGARKP
ncbi:MAG TPA: P1 family peptidase [Planctomycetota bacterium]|nr:P1 family peptidase [Planctomycetota bacterium]